MTPVMSRKQRIEAAIEAALAGDWKRAAAENRALLAEAPRDVEAANRLGKALTELGQKKQAIEAYRVALEIDPANAIARKNLARLEDTKAGGKSARARRATPPELAKPATSLIEASDRAAEFHLQQPNLRALAKLDPGDPAQFEPNPRGVAVKSMAGELLGYIEPRAGLRLRRMIEGGNRYSAVIRSIAPDRGAIVHIRETFKHPSLVGQTSFLQSPSARRRLFRAYTKSSVVRYDRDIEFEFEEGESEEPSADAWRPRAAAAATEDDDESGDVAFSDDAVEVDDDDDDIAIGDDSPAANEEEEDD
ncbi:MAG: tetratricopeptide repeat protein [Chloroflexi bacterium]|nr:tetratricopeptide repeat protein [Chloroflexota bacterium]